MNSQFRKLVFPLLLGLILALATWAYASQGHEAAPTADSGHGVAHSVQAATGNGHAASATEHGASEGHGTKEAGHAAAQTSHGGGHDAAHSSSLSPAKLKDLFWRTINFIALVIILVKFLAKPIGSGLSGRRKQIQEELEELEAKRDKAERSYKEFEARLAGMEKEMETIVEKAVAQAENEKERILKEAERAAEDIKRQAEAAVKAEIVDAKRRLRDEIADQAAAMAEELIVKNLTPEDQIAITEQYLERVGAAQ